MGGKLALDWVAGFAWIECQLSVEYASRIRETHPQLADHLEESIHTGSRCTTDRAHCALVGHFRAFVGCFLKRVADMALMRRSSVAATIILACCLFCRRT